MCRVSLTLVVLEHLHLLLVGLGNARELLDSSVDTLKERVSSGRHEVRGAVTKDESKKKKDEKTKRR